MRIIAQIVALLFGIVLHEVGHAAAASALGDPTARRAGRITLNPLAHIDPFGTVILPLLLVLTRSPVLFGFAKPVPFNPSYFRDARKGIMLVGLSGPLTNLALAVLGAVVLRIGGMHGVAGFFLVHFCVINLVLGVFNLIPIPPLDGSRVVLGLLPGALAAQYVRLERFGFLIIFGLLYVGVLDRILIPVTGAMLRILLPGG